jgi:RNA polymerase sigma factor (sigma-70 family)
MSVGTRDLSRDNATTEVSLAERVDALYVEHHARVYALALNFGGGDHAWAEDITQDVFFTLLEKLEGLPDRGDPGPWLRRVTINRCISLQRRRNVRSSPLVRWVLREAWTEPAPEMQMDVSEDLRRVWRAVTNLPPKQRAVFSLRHFDDVSQTEIAKTLGYSDGYVSKLLDRAQRQVRSQARPDEASKQEEEVVDHE